MNEMKKYTVMELADLVGVPRTTINDWLSRYSQYIDFKMQGKRKIYVESSLTVLKEISGLRNSGLSSFDIEEELAKRHPVHAELAPPQPESKEEEAAEEKSHPEEYSLIVKKQTDEIAKMIAEHLQNMARRIENIESFNRREAAKTRRWYFMAVLFIAILSGLILAAGLKFEGYFRENLRLQQKNGAISSQLSVMENDLKKQSDDFRKALESLKENETKKEAEILRLRDQFAKEKLEMLKDVMKDLYPESIKDDVIKKFQQDEASKTTEYPVYDMMPDTPRP
ncbi:MAG: hypothetical protein A2017_02445 [Lentisphaerae bacterium GWF2_44_16]|nr:MAG: hypothetical protein A2017_02445 [Lentisphaerae bacterium GWF2_44_16]